MKSLTHRGFAVAMMTLLIVVSFSGTVVHAQQTDTRGNPAQEEQSRPSKEERGSQRRGLLAEMTAFKTDVPAHPFDIVLARPTHHSMTVSVVAYANSEGSIEYGQVGQHAKVSTPVSALPAGKPVLFEIGHLEANAAYEYRLKYKAQGQAGGEMLKSEQYSFHTPRAPGKESTFTFVIQADSHLDQGVEPAVYEQTLANMLASGPDFMIDLGDTFMTDKRGANFTSSLAQYDAQRYYFGLVAHSAPLFMVLGNHDGEKGTSGTRDSDIGPWSYRQRTSRFPSPIIDEARTATAMYSGSTEMNDGVGSHYYAFEWGNALFIVLDPYWSTTDRIRGGGGGARGGSEKGTGDRRVNDEPLKPLDSSWASTLGKAQYDWLTRTLERTEKNPGITHRFVFIHHLVGGVGGAESRGGVESSHFFEWGGQNADGSPGFAQHRDGWAMPIHDLLAKHHVSAVFHGHDHLYVRSERDGVVYQCVPQPGNPRGNTRTADHYGYASGTIQGSPGHVRVLVTESKAVVEFIRTIVTQPKEERARNGRAAEANGAVVHRYEIEAQGSE